MAFWSFNIYAMNDFNHLVLSIEGVHHHLQSQAVQAVNQALTVRNWMIGYYIVEYEQEGRDRADYGSTLLPSLAKGIQIKGLSAPELSRCRQFYSVYPQLKAILPPKLAERIDGRIFGTVSQELQGVVSECFMESGSDTLGTLPLVPVDKLVSHLSFSHFVELLKIEHGLKRAFYEIEAIKGVWSVRELKRQIGSQYFERCGMSEKADQLIEKVRSRIKPTAPKDIVKNIYAFEFLDIPFREAMEESDLEAALLDNLQKFMLELGNGFCFEAKQKRILVGGNYYFLDLLFYHRILRCHVVLELKLGAFEPGDLGQLSMYLNYTRDVISESSDNPPLGILLVAEKNNALVRYTMGTAVDNLFVQEYLLQLPSAEQLQGYFQQELSEWLPMNWGA